MWSPLQSILVCKIPQFLVKSYRFKQLITLFQKVDTLVLLKIYMMFCPPAGAKYPFFQAPAHGLLSTLPTPPMLHSQHTIHSSTPPTLARNPRTHAPTQPRHPRHPRQHEQHAISQTLQSPLFEYSLFCLCLVYFFHLLT